MYCNPDYAESIMFVPTKNIELAGFSLCGHHKNLGFTCFYKIKINSSIIKEGERYFDEGEGFYKDLIFEDPIEVKSDEKIIISAKFKCD